MDSGSTRDMVVELLARELKDTRSRLYEVQKSASTPCISAGDSSNNRMTQEEERALISENGVLKAENASLQEKVHRLEHELSRAPYIKSEEGTETTTTFASAGFAKLLVENEELIRERKEALLAQEKLLALQEKYKRLKAKKHEYDEVLDGLRIALSNCTEELNQSRMTAVSEIDFRNFFDEIPYEPAGDQPQLSAIPVHAHYKKLPKSLMEVCDGPYFINCQEVIWSPSGIGLGLVTKPTFQYNPKSRDGTWTQLKNDFDVGRRMDICCLSGKTLRYLGTYERVGLGQMVIAPSTVKYLNREKLDFISKSTTRFRDMMPPSQTQMIKNMYKQGVVKIQCFGIRHVAFNKVFAKRLEEWDTSSIKQNPNGTATSHAATNISGSTGKRKRDASPSDRLNKKRYEPFVDE